MRTTAEGISTGRVLDDTPSNSIKFIRLGISAPRSADIASDYCALRLVVLPLRQRSFDRDVGGIGVDGDEFHMCAAFRGGRVDRHFGVGFVGRGPVCGCRGGAGVDGSRRTLCRYGGGATGPGR